MGRAIVEALVPVVIAAFVLWGVLYYRRKQHQELLRSRGWAERGDMNRRQEAHILVLNAKAAAIFRSMLDEQFSPFSDPTVLSQADRKRIDGWLKSNRIQPLEDEGIHE